MEFPGNGLRMVADATCDIGRAGVKDEEMNNAPALEGDEEEDDDGEEEYTELATAIGMVGRGFDRIDVRVGFFLGMEAWRKATRYIFSMEQYKVVQESMMYVVKRAEGLQRRIVGDSVTKYEVSAMLRSVEANAREGLIR